MCNIKQLCFQDCRHLLHPLVWILNLPIVTALSLEAPSEGEVSLLLAAVCVSAGSRVLPCVVQAASPALCELFASNSEYLFRYCSVINKY
jgi:hypothetical protein